MIHSIEEVAEIIKNMLELNRKNGSICTIVVRDDGRKVRVGERATTMIVKETLKWK